MRRTRRLALAATASVVPVLVGAPPAGAATAEDTEQVDLAFTSGAATVGCPVFASHEVDTETGELAAGLSSFSDGCRADITITVSYKDIEGNPKVARGGTVDGRAAFVTHFDAGSTDVTVDHQITFLQGCTSNCTHNLQTDTK